MIIRAFHATATADGAGAYHDHFTRTVLPTLQAVNGYHGAYLLRRDRHGHVELQVLTLWASLEAVRRFAATNLDHAVVEPDAEAALTSYDPTVIHHRVVVDTVTTATNHPDRSKNRSHPTP